MLGGHSSSHDFAKKNTEQATPPVVPPIVAAGHARGTNVAPPLHALPAAATDNPAIAPVARIGKQKSWRLKRQDEMHSPLVPKDLRGRL
jgi:hypothetical protein